MPHSCFHYQKFTTFSIYIFQPHTHSQPLNLQSTWKSDLPISHPSTISETIMNPLKQTVTILFLLSLALQASHTEAVGRPPSPPSAAFCRNPSVIRQVHIPAYTGRWFQIYASGSAVFISRSSCVTANYTLTENGELDVLNCFFTPDMPRASCLNGSARVRRGGRTSQLEVQFPGTPYSNYNVAAILGNPNYGYAAVAVYSCRVVGNDIFDGFFILARVPFQSQRVLKRLKDKLKCMGYAVDDHTFERTKHAPECSYFSGEKGFDIDSTLGVVMGAARPPSTGASRPPSVMP